MMTGHAFQLAGSLGVLFVSVICITTHAQSTSGFVSIDCGANPHYDAFNKFEWESDDKYTVTGESGGVPSPVNATLENYQALQSFRSFSEIRQKHCYQLPTTTSNNSFLIRAMFLHGGAAGLALPIAFNVFFNATAWFTVQYHLDDSPDVLSTPQLFEGIFYSPGGIVNFCLVPIIGVPFISSLEMRPLDPSGNMYSYPGREKFYLSTLYRWNYGAPLGSRNIRFPDDSFDRLWYTPGDWNRDLSFAATAPASNSTTPDVNNVPPKVMQNAWMNNTANGSFSLNFNFDNTVRKVYAAVYIEEIDLNISSKLNVRGFEITPRGVVNSHSWLVNATSSARMHHWNLPVLNGEMTFDFVGLPWSMLGPVVNAIEVYAQVDWNFSTTAIQDVNGLIDLQSNFNSTHWRGDPCYPVSFDWVTCNYTNPSNARVTHLLLSNKYITGHIPSTISQMDALVEIYLDNNRITGQIPDSLANLKHLTLLLLNDNNLDGVVPSSLQNKPGLTFKYYNNKQLQETQGPSTSITSRKQHSISNGLLVGIVCGGALLLGLVLVLAFSVRSFYFKKKRLDVEPREFKSRKEVQSVSLETLRVATDNFKTQIGEGSYGAVYHGRLSNIEVAVKVNKVENMNVNNDEPDELSGHSVFKTEVDILTRVHHLNLVSLLGYCDNGTQFILIYEYLAKGTLREWLYDDRENPQRGLLDWTERLKIATDAARGLEYLHKGCNPSIIHHDVKSSNILLDPHKIAKVADFGLSKSISSENLLGPYSSHPKGTRGYLDPEYEKLGRWTHKSDVYSFGVVLAEIISGRPPITRQEDGKYIMLVDWLINLVEKADLQTLADPKLEGNFNIESMWMMVDIIRACVGPEAQRPDITKVLRDITTIIEFEKEIMVTMVYNHVSNE